MSGVVIPKVGPGGSAPKAQPGGPPPKDKGKGKKGAGLSLAAAGTLVPVWMTAETAKALVHALTWAVAGNIQPKKKKGKK